MAEMRYTIDYDIQRIGQTLAELGASVQEMSEAIQKITKVLNQTNWGNAEVNALKEELDDIRPAMDIEPEIPNQKGDLEIFNQNGENSFSSNFIDLDSEEFLNQRLSWDFKADWHGK